VVRNRIKRRIREAVRARLPLLSPQWQVVINPRRRVLTAGFPDLVQEIEKLFLRCNAQP
jgi:ribonuclease P protein component